MTVDSRIVTAFTCLTNFSASKFTISSAPFESITSLTELWKKHGNMIGTLLKCDTTEFSSPELFYEVLNRKLSMANGSLASALRQAEAANGDLFEICKFYAAYLEFMRSEHSDILTSLLEKLTSDTGFDSTIFLDMFSHFDKLYEEDSVENWWEYLQSDEQELPVGLRTPTRSDFNQRAFTTPTATARRLRTAASSARRSPIAEAVDSPQMKYMRSERELKQARKKMLELEQAVDELESENSSLKGETREQKMLIAQLRQDACGRKNFVENAEQIAIELTAALEAKQKEVDALGHQLEESRNALRTEQRNLAALEAEKEAITTKLATVTRDRDSCLNQLRDLRDSNEHDFSNWHSKERELNENLRVVAAEKNDLAEHLAGLETLKQNLLLENKRLSQAMEDLSLVSSRNQQDADNLRAQLDETKENCNNSIASLQKEQSERMKMTDTTIRRLQRELEEERNEKKAFQALLNDLNDKVLNDEKSSHEKNEGFLSVRACLETAKLRIEQLEVGMSGKDAAIAYKDQQIERTCDMLLTEKDIREKLVVQHKSKLDMLQNTVDEKAEELKDLRENMKNLVQKHSEEMSTLKKRLNEMEQANCELTNENARLEGQIDDSNKELLAKALCSKLLEYPHTRSESPDSLNEFLSRNGDRDTEEELQKMVAQTPRKSVAFSLNMDGDECGEDTPFGFKSNMNAPRESMNSLEFGDRLSTARSSIRSDSTLLSVHSEFKQPFIPSGTSKERVGILTARNEKVKPHLQSSYATEMGEVNSPSADEEAVRKPKKSRRESIVSTIFRRN